MAYHQKPSRGDLYTMQESKRMRLSCIINGITAAKIAAGCGCSVNHAAKWLSEDKDLAQEYQCRLQQQYPVLAPVSL